MRLYASRVRGERLDIASLVRTGRGPFRLHNDWWFRVAHTCLLGVSTQFAIAAWSNRCGAEQVDAVHVGDAGSATSSDSTNATPNADSDSKADSRRHFDNGVKLFEDRNYTAALAEFEAAYRQYPSASALQNIALCQKQLYRYSDARESLIRLKRDHLGELESVDRATVDDAIRELANLIGSVRISAQPSNAKITLDGHALSAEALRAPIVLDVGEHLVTAEADGFAPASRAFRVAGGHVEVPVSLRLTETTGTVVILAPDQHTAIAIDGRPVAFAQWRGRVEPGRHFVQIYREGFEPYEEEIEVEIGATVTVRGTLGDRTDPTETVAAPPGQASTAKRTPRGYYGLLGGSILVPRGQPAGFDAASDYDLGWSLGLRAGYRINGQLGVEGHVDSGSFAVQGHCTNLSTTACPTSGDSTYHLDTRRIGASLRLFSGGETIRLTSTFGAGLVSQDFHYANHRAAGLDEFVSIEAGLQANWRHALFELVGTAIFDGASNIHVADFRPYADGNGIHFFGLSLRVGWGEWTPARAPLPPMPSVSQPTRAPSATGTPGPSHPGPASPSQEPRGI